MCNEPLCGADQWRRRRWGEKGSGCPSSSCFTNADVGVDPSFAFMTYVMASEESELEVQKGIDTEEF